MKIGKENIEPLIFDYHEGNLSDSEKADVLNYIHNHPEYEIEFTLWAQSYIHSDKATKDYGLTNKLIRTSSVACYNNVWIRISIPVLIGALFILYHFTNQEIKSVTSEEINPLKEKTINTEANSISPTISNTQNSKKNTITSTSKKEKDHSDIPADIHITKETDASLPTTKADQSTDNGTIKNTTANSGADSTAEQIDVQPTIKTAKEQIDKKRKPYKIKSADKFIPTNPDF